MSDFYGKVYRYGDKIVGVVRGLGPVWIVAWKTATGGSRRLKVRRLAPSKSAQVMQDDLDAWAADLGLQEAQA